VDGLLPEYEAEVMEKFFNPRSVVVVGASRKTGPGSFNIVENLLNLGYKGRVWAVNPKASEILGVPCFPRAGDLPEVPDLAIITVPREIMPPVIRDCCERGIKLFTLVPQGLAEADEAGRAIQAEFMETVRRAGARVLGPNTLGTVNTFDDFSSSFMPLDPGEPVPTAVICQTGLFVATDIGATVRVGKGIDVGNQVDIGFPDALRYLADDPRIEVVAMHMEGLRPGEGRRFVSVLRDAVRRKPVVIYKTGRSAVGAAAAGSHSGSLAGSHAVYQAAFEQAGAILVRDVDDMDDSVKALLYLAPMKGRRIAVVTVSGGGGIMAADACEEYGLELAEFTPETMEALRELYPAWMDPGNPLDVWPAAIGKFYPEVFVRCFNLVADDPNVDGVLCVGGSFGEGSFDLSEFLALSGERRDKPITWWLHGRKTPAVAEKAERTRKIAVFTSADRAVRALSRVAAYHVDIRPRLESEQDKASPPAGIDSGRAAAILQRAAGCPAGPAGVAALGPEAYDLLEAYGIPLAGWRTAATPEGAANEAAALGFPVALKAVGPRVLHKSELGAVRLDLGSREEVLQAGRDILSRVPGHSTVLLIQRFLPGGDEVIIGAKRDPHFGATVLFGLGGIFTEILGDVAIGLAPLSEAQARRLIGRLKGRAVLEGARGREPADIEALVDALVRVSWLAADHPEIAELDLNPVKAFAAGKGCAAVDARVLVG